jgi:CubicO group peptidase (beta-lactamase class C family)
MRYRNIVGTLIPSVLACAPPSASLTPASPPHSPALARIQARLDSLVGARVAPSFAVAVARDGEIIFQTSAGFQDREHAVLATPHTIYPLASVAKSITAIAIMRLVEDGRLRLDEPVSTYIGRDIVRVHSGDPRTLTIRTLLSMTGGVPHLYLHHWADDPHPPAAERDLVRRYGFSAFPPGRFFHYSNMSFGVLQHVISTVTGMPFGRYVETAVFRPLGLRHSVGDVPAALASSAARLYMARDERAVAYRHLEPRGGAWFYSSAHDLAILGSTLGIDSAGGTPRAGRSVLGSTHRRVMLDFSRRPYYALGWWGGVTPSGLLTAIADGQAVGTTASMKLLPQFGVAAVALTNQAISNDVTLALVDSLLAAVEPAFAQLAPAGPMQIPAEFIPQPLVATAEWRGEWTGAVTSSEGTRLLALSIDSGAPPTLRIAGGAPVALRSPTVMNGLLEATVPATLPLAETDGVPHRLELRLRVDGDHITGYLVAASTAERPRFGLPFHVELRRQR